MYSVFVCFPLSTFQNKDYFKISDYVRFYFYVLNTAPVEQGLKAYCRIYGMTFPTRPRRGIQRNVCTVEGPVTVASFLQSE